MKELKGVGMNWDARWMSMQGKQRGPKILFDGAGFYASSPTYKIQQLYSWMRPLIKLLS